MADSLLTWLRPYPMIVDPVLTPIPRKPLTEDDFADESYDPESMNGTGNQEFCVARFRSQSTVPCSLLMSESDVCGEALSCVPSSRSGEDLGP